MKETYSGYSNACWPISQYSSNNESGNIVFVQFLSVSMFLLCESQLHALHVTVSYWWHIILCKHCMLFHILREIVCPHALKVTYAQYLICNYKHAAYACN